MWDMSEKRLDVEEIRDRLEEGFGDGLRVLATGDLEEATYDISVLRDDLVDEYTTEAAEQLFDDVLSERYFDIGSPTQTCGGQEHTVRLFEECFSIIRWLETRAIFVELDRDQRWSGCVEALDGIEESVPEEESR